MVGRSTLPITAAMFTEPLLEPLEQYQRDVLRDRVTQLQLHRVVRLERGPFLTKADYIVLLRADQQSKTPATWKRLAVSTANSSRHNDSDNSTANAVAVRPKRTRAQAQRAASASATPATAPTTKLGVKFPKTGAPRLVEPLDQYAYKVLRQAVVRLGLRETATRLGRWNNLTTSNYIELIRGHYYNSKRMQEDVDTDDSSDNGSHKRRKRKAAVVASNSNDERDNDVATDAQAHVRRPRALPKHTARPKRLSAQRATSPSSSPEIATTTAAASIEPLHEPLERYERDVLLRERWRSNERTNRAAATPAAAIANEQDGNRECDDDDTGNMMSLDNTDAIANSCATAVRRKRATNVAIKKGFIVATNENTGSDTDPLVEPLEQYPMVVLRRVATRMGIHNSSVHGSSRYTMKCDFIAMIREHWRSVERMRRMRKAAAVASGDHSRDDSDGEDSGSDELGGIDNEDDDTPVVESTATEATSSEQQHLHMNGGSGACKLPRTLDDIVVTELQRSYWTLKNMIARTKLGTARLAYAEKHAKLYGDSS